MPMTLSTTEIGDIFLRELKVRVPFLFNTFATDFSGENVKSNQQVIARMALVGNAVDYHATTGFNVSTQELSSLYADVPVTIDQFKHYPIKLSLLNAAKTEGDQVRLVKEQSRIGATVIAKAIVDSILAKITPANFSQEEVETAANTDLETLNKLREKLKRTVGSERFLFLNSSAFSALSLDQRIASRDYHGQQIGAEAYGHFSNVGGFANIYEYPDMPSANNLVGFGGSRESLIVATRLPNDVSAIASSLGVPEVMKWDTISDEDTGLSMALVSWQQAGTGDVYLSPTLMWGSAAGKQAALADDGALTDYAGVRQVSASTGD